MSKRTRALVLGVTLAGMNLAGLTAAQAHPNDDPTSNRHRALGQLGLLAAADHATASQEQTTTDTAAQAGLAQERYYSTWGYADTPAPAPDEPSGQPDWLVLGLGVLAAALALSTGLAVLAARRAGRRMRAGQAA